MRVIILCGGWSVSQYDVADLREHGYVIGVNESSVLFQCHAGITMDRLWAEHRFDRFFRTRAGTLWVRRGAAKNLPENPRLKIFDCNHRSGEMTDFPHVFNGTNSGMCALNLAYQLRTGPVYIFGLDMQKGPKGEGYHHPVYEWVSEASGGTKPGKYRDWIPDFAVVYEAFRKRGIELKQVNNRSKVTSIPSISYVQFLKELRK